MGFRLASKIETLNDLERRNDHQRATSAVAFREVVLSDFALMSTDVRENSSYIKSFAVDKLLAAAAAKLWRLQSID